MKLTREVWKGACRHAPLVALCVFAVFPLYWMIACSFKPLGEILDPGLLPISPTAENYAEAARGIPILRLTSNTVIIAAAETLSQLFTALLAAYALTRWDFRGRGFVYILLNLTWLIPFQAIMIPNYVTVSSLNLRGSLLGVILPFTASSFAILSIYSAFKSFPKALIEAAVMDGLTEWSILFRIVLPNIKAPAVSLGILLFINGWNEYIWAMLVSSNLNDAPIQIGLQQFMSGEGNEWGPLMAAATLSSVPIIALYIILRKQIINSFVKWGIK
jgi:multiple sugar transport system permease protein/sn-glycerol 3-phosphate transport system permease protein